MRRRVQRRSASSAAAASAAASAAAAIAGAAGGCADLPAPAEITEPEILAVRVVPASVPPGGETRVEIFAADTEGPLEAVSSSWEVGEGIGGAPPLGGMATAAGEAPIYAAPDEVGAEHIPPLAVLEGEIELPQRDVSAVKTVLVGEEAENPSIERVALDGQEAEGGHAASAGAEIELDVEADIPLEDPGDVAWAATAGEIEPFLRTPVTWTLPEDAAGEAWLYVVVRDGQDGGGGADWRALQIDIEP